MIKYKIYPTLLDSLYWYTKFPNKNYQELLDKINRVEKPMPEAAKKGVAFEALVNDVIDGVKLEVDGFNQYEKDGLKFGTKLVNKIAEDLNHCSKKQEFVTGRVETSVGIVELYGFIDFTFDNHIVDLKTTSKYTKEKYINNHQHICYPLIKDLNGGFVDGFSYYVTDFKDTYIETYEYNKELFNNILDKSIILFDKFVQENQNKITNTKIYGTN
jgi:hypothetical protein